LTKDAAQITAGKKDRSGAIGAGNAGLLPVVKSSAGCG